MQTQNQKTNKRESGLFIYFLILTGFFFLLEISFFIQCNRVYLSDFSFVSGYVHIPITILPGIIYFIMAQFLVHFLYCVFIWMITLFLTKMIPLNPFRGAQHAAPAFNRKLYWGIGVWSLTIVTILTANQYFFPNSKFAELTELVLINKSITQFVFIASSLCCACIFFLACVGFLKWLIKKSFFYIPVLLTTGLVFLNYPHSSITANVATSQTPNIILIGVDSLRPDFLSYFGYERETPFFNSFLSEATVFTEALTPLARTFPSWSSILLGKYPKETKIRFNLAAPKGIDFTDSLPFILKRNGYETIYATDETRFSNIDTNFGFDRIVTPKMGLNDFLLGTFNDFPLSNLIVNTWVGKWLFPYSYANRPAYFTYKPQSFLNLIRPVLDEQRKNPLFLVVHFCLPHSPYLWASLSGNDYNIRERYVESILCVDKQINDFYAQLNKNHLLDHAIVLLLSDHGEALEFTGDRITESELFVKTKASEAVPQFYPPSLDREEINQSAGHGTDVLGLPQYHTVLAFKFYGIGEQYKGMVPGIVSLLSIKPTLLEFLRIPSKRAQSVSLLSAIRGKAKIALQHIFLESDFSPESIRTVYPETRKVLLEGIQLFKIDQLTTRLTVKPSMGEMIIKSKQYADIYGDWMLALYPQNDQSRMPILINLVSGEWSNDLDSPFAKHSPAYLMQKKLQAFFGDEESTASPLSLKPLFNQ